MWKTFAVKAIYRTKTTGAPCSKSEGYSEDFDMVEERVVTFKARSSDEALERAAKEAEEYAADSFINPFGQEVSWYYTGEAVGFELYNSVRSNLEVFSNTYLVPRSLSDEQLADNSLGQSFDNEKELRLNFQSSEFTEFR